MRRILFDNVSNMRDLGGYSNYAGEITRFGRFIRSNLPEVLSEKEKEILLERNFKTVIDLRSEFERKSNKHALDEKRFSYNCVDLSMLGNIDFSKLDLSNFEIDFPDMYKKLLENKKKMKEVMDIILNSEGNVLFNCTAGKDRTGVVSMLLLMIADIPKTDIVADYTLTDVYLEERIIEIMINGMVIPVYMGEVKKEFMEETIDFLVNIYGDIHEYMRFIGLSTNDVEKIRNKLIGCCVYGSRNGRRFAFSNLFYCGRNT